MMNNEQLDFLFQNSTKVINTNWYVITGAPSSGKTTLINQLSDLGYSTNQDISRQVIEKSLSKGLTLNQVYANEFQLQKRILHSMLENSLSLSPLHTIFHDYSFPDNIPYLKLSSEKITPEYELAAKLFKFKGVFICEPLQFEVDNIRKETKSERLFLYKQISSYYTELGYKSIELPALSVKERIEIIIRNI